MKSLFLSLNSKVFLFLLFIYMAKIRQDEIHQLVKQYLTGGKQTHGPMCEWDVSEIKMKIYKFSNKFNKINL